MRRNSDRQFRRRSRTPGSITSTRTPLARQARYHHPSGADSTTRKPSRSVDARRCGSRQYRLTNRSSPTGRPAPRSRVRNAPRPVASMRNRARMSRGPAGAVNLRAGRFRPPDKLLAMLSGRSWPKIMRSAAPANSSPHLGQSARTPHNPALLRRGRRM